MSSRRPTWHGLPEGALCQDHAEAVDRSGSDSPWHETGSAVSGTTSGPSPVIGAALGALAVVFLVWRGHRVAATALAVVVVTLVGARRASPTFDRWMEVGLARLARVVGIVLTWLCLGFLVVVVIAPVWAVTTVLRWNTLEPALDGGRWARRRLRPWQSRPDRPFADERRSLAPKTQLHALAVVAVPVALVALLAFPLRPAAQRLAGWAVPGHVFIDTPDPPTDTVTGVPSATPAPPPPDLQPSPDPSGDPPDGSVRDVGIAHRDVPWADDYFDDLFSTRFGFDPVLTVRVADHRGPYVNVSDRVRRSYVPTGAADDPTALDVWFFGASALFGQGQRDDHTIVSEVARLADESGVPLRSTNFGVPSYWAWQDDMLMAQMLSERPLPDLIVTYEGYNDIGHTIAPGSPTSVSTGFADEVQRALIGQAADLAGSGGLVEGVVPRTTFTSAENSATILGRSAGLARDLAHAHGIPIAQFLQPSVYTRDLAVDDATLANIGSDLEWRDTWSVAWNQARALATVDGVIDLGDSLDDVDEVVYYDDVHTNELGARVVAEAMYAELAPAIELLHVAKAPAARG